MNNPQPITEAEKYEILRQEQEQKKKEIKKRIEYPHFADENIATAYSYRKKYLY